MRLLPLPALLFLALATPTFADEAADQIKQDEQTLREADLGVDGPALLEFFRRRTPTEEQRKGIEALVGELGAESFATREKATRELIVAGPAAQPFLKAALKSDDIEVQRRAERCLEVIEKTLSGELLCAATRLLAQRRPEGSTAALLAFLPFAAEEHVAEEVRSALAATAVQGGKPDPILLDALDDRSALKRAAAAEAILLAAGPEHRAAARALLKDDDARVRLAVVLALVEKKDNEALPHLVPLLGDVPADQLWRLEQVLLALAGEAAPTVSPGDTPAQREKYEDAWEKWWKAQEGKLDLARVELGDRSLGLTLITQLDNRGGPAGINGRVFEIGRDGKARWEITGLNYPTDAQVVGPDRVLITEYRGRRVTERNFKGEIVWSHTLPTYVLGAQRLANGHTVINCRTYVTEVDRAGKEVFTYRPPGLYALAARKAKNGDLWVLDRTQGCLRLDKTGKEVRRINVGVVQSTVGTCFDVTPAGNVLVPHSATNKVAEYNADGKKVWEATAERPSSVVRLPGGNTLVAGRTNRQVVEINRDGKVVWQHQPDQGTVIQARRR